MLAHDHLPRQDDEVQDADDRRDRGHADQALPDRCSGEEGPRDHHGDDRRRDRGEQQQPEVRDVAGVHPDREPDAERHQRSRGGDARHHERHAERSRAEELRARPHGSKR